MYGVVSLEQDLLLDVMSITFMFAIRCQRDWNLLSLLVNVLLKNIMQHLKISKLMTEGPLLSGLFLKCNQHRKEASNIMRL